MRPSSASIAARVRVLHHARALPDAALRGALHDAAAAGEIDLLGLWLGTVRPQIQTGFGLAQDVNVAALAVRFKNARATVVPAQPPGGGTVTNRDVPVPDDVLRHTLSFTRTVEKQQLSRVNFRWWEAARHSATQSELDTRLVFGRARSVLPEPAPIVHILTDGRPEPQGLTLRTLRVGALPLSKGPSAIMSASRCPSLPPLFLAERLLLRRVRAVRNLEVTVPFEGRPVTFHTSAKLGCLKQLTFGRVSMEHVGQWALSLLGGAGPSLAPAITLREVRDICWEPWRTLVTNVGNAPRVELVNCSFVLGGDSSGDDDVEAPDETKYWPDDDTMRWNALRRFTVRDTHTAPWKFLKHMVNAVFPPHSVHLDMEFIHGDRPQGPLRDGSVIDTLHLGACQCPLLH